MKKTRCKACGRKMKFTKDRHYIVSTGGGLFAALTGMTYYDAYDCAYCGSQLIVGVREINIVDNNAEEGEEDDEDQTN